MKEYKLTKCELCDGQRELRANQRYQYVESGLDNVWLDGIETIVCTNCGDVNGLIPRINHLHETIALALALQPVPLTGAAARFLRKVSGYKRNDWAALLRVNPATLSRWENGIDPIGPQSDNLIRLLYVRLREERDKSFLAAFPTSALAAINGGATPAIVVKVSESVQVEYA